MKIGMRFWTVTVILLLTLVVPPIVLALETRAITVGGVPLTVEVADDMYERAAGLMYRDYLPQGRGMLFVYPDERPLSFWMKNTLIPLSIAFIDGKGKIVAILDMFPDDGTMHYKSPRPARYALEVNLGWFKANGVTVGDDLNPRPR
jgi:hypothetical protein